MALSHGLLTCVTVSPTFTSRAFLIPDIMYPTSPVVNSLLGFISIFRTPTSSASYSIPVCTNFTLSPLRIVPFVTLHKVIMPRNELKIESNISACKGAFVSPLGAGIRSTMARNISGTPSPVFPLALIMSLRSQPIRSTISSSTSSGIALGISILLITGIISRLLSIAIYKFDMVCA